MRRTISFISILSFLFIGCTGDHSSQYAYRPPESINDGLDVGSLGEVGIDSVLIEKAVDEIRSGDYREVHSMLLLKDGKAK